MGQVHCGIYGCGPTADQFRLTLDYYLSQGITSREAPSAIPTAKSEVNMTVADATARKSR